MTATAKDNLYVAWLVICLVASLGFMAWTNHHATEIIHQRYPGAVVEWHPVSLRCWAGKQRQEFAFETENVRGYMCYGALMEERFHVDGE